MYNNAYASTEFNNNPFINDPTNAQSRFPDLSGTSPNPGQFTQWLQPATNPNAGYLAQQPGVYQQQQQQELPPQYPTFQSTSYMTAAGSPQMLAPPQTGMPFQPSSSFGQHMAANMGGSSYGYLQGQTPQQPGYSPVQQQLQSPTYLSQFDPYASLGQALDGPSQMGSPQIATGSGAYSAPTPPSASGNPHPRDYIHTHKIEIEAWDSHAWKQLLNAFDSLKNAWEGRTKELQSKIGQFQSQLQLQYQGGGYYAIQIQQEVSRLQEVLKNAQSNFDSVAASSFQMHEVFQGYRQSGDLASKRRVREASNASLQGLPDWPPQVY